MKMRKILPLLFLLLVCILCLCACGETKDSSSQPPQGKQTDIPTAAPVTQVPMLDPYADVTGKWWTGYSDYIKLERVTETGLNNAKVTLTFDRNGNYVMAIPDYGREIPGEYTLNSGILYIGPFGPFDCAVRDGCLYLSSQEDNIRVILYREY